METLENRSYRKSVLPADPMPCVHPGCRRPSFAKLEDGVRCQLHFIDSCYAKLDEASQLIEEKQLCGAELESVRAFLAECTSVTESHAVRAPGSNNQLRTQLLDIAISAAQLLTRLRRSPRIERQVPVRLLGDPLTNPRIEDTVTQTVSEHGAMFNSASPYTRGEIVDILRLDTGHSAIARIAWHQPIGPGQHRVAVELLNRANFWN